MENRLHRMIRSINRFDPSKKLLFKAEKQHNAEFNEDLVKIDLFYTDDYSRPEIKVLYTDTNEFDGTTPANLQPLAGSIPLDSIVLYRYDIGEQKLFFVSKVKEGTDTVYKLYVNHYRTFDKTTVTSDDIFKEIEVVKNIDSIVEVKVDFHYSYDSTKIEDYVFYSIHHITGATVVKDKIKAFGETLSGDLGVTESGPRIIPSEKALNIVLKTDVQYPEESEIIDTSEATPYVAEKLNITEDMVLDLYRDIITVIGANRDVDSAVEFIQTLKDTVDSEGKIIKNKSYAFNSGMSGVFVASDKTTLEVSERDEDFAIIYSTISLCNLEIYIDEHTRVYNKSKLYTAYDQMRDKKPFLHVFVNGRKVRDNEVRYYLKADATDIIIPKRYLSKDIPNTIVIERKFSLNYMYYSSFIPELEYNNGITIPFNNPAIIDPVIVSKIKNQILNDKTVNFYLDGYLVPDFTLGNNNTVTFNMTKTDGNPLNPADINGKSLEIVVESAIKAKHTINEKVKRNIDKYYFYLPENKHIDIKSGPISKLSCYFFIKEEVNGYTMYKKIAATDVTQVSRYSFEMQLEEPLIDDIHTNIIMLTDTNLGIKDSLTESYADDYYINNALGVGVFTEFINGLTLEQDNTRDTERVKRLKELLTSEYPDDPNFDSLRQTVAKYVSDNPENKRYSMRNFHLINKIVESCTDRYEVAKELVKFRPYLLRSLLKNYGRKQTIKVFDKLPEDSVFDISLGVAPLYGDIDNFYTVTVNGYYIPKFLYEIRDLRQYEVVVVDIAKVKKYNSAIINDTGKNYVTLVHELSSYSKIDRLLVKPKNIQKNPLTDTYYCIIPTFPSIKEESDYTVLQESSNERDMLYIAGTNKGYKKFKGKYTVKVNKTDKQVGELKPGTTLIDFGGEKPRRPLLICSKRFKFAFSHTFDKIVTDLMDTIIPITVGDNVIPVIPNYGYKVYLNGKLLIENKEYSLKSPENNNSITYSAIIVKKRVKENDTITILFDNIENQTVVNSPGEHLNEYGLIYMGNLKFPYDPKYVDIILNGKLILPHQIEILSDKLIRIPEELQPFRDIYISTTLTKDISLFKDFTDIYHTYTEKKYSGFEHVLRRWFNLFDYSIPEVEKKKDIILKTGKFKAPSEINRIYNLLDFNIIKKPELIESYTHNYAIEYKIYKPNPKRNINDIYDTLSYIEPLINAYVIWLKSNNVKTQLKPHLPLKRNIWKYFILFMDDGEQNISIKPYENCLYKNISLTHSKYPLCIKDPKNPSIMYANTFFLMWLRRSGITINEKTMRKYVLTDTERNTLYPRDIPKSFSGKSKLFIPKGCYLRIGGSPPKDPTKPYVSDIDRNYKFNKE